VNFTATRLARRLPAEVETILFRIVQEALSNVARHAQAAQVTVSLDQVENQVWLTVCDDGAGFDPAQLPTDETGRGLGLVGMRERAALVGGTCQIESQPGQGTCVTASLPIAA
jgi:two-component system sensor histidine kinase UhpB